MLYLDLETRSQEDLIAHGLLRYAQHPTTEVICMSYCFGDGEIATWFAEDGGFPNEVVAYFQSGKPIVAHNAAFERHLFDFVIANDYGFQPPRLEQWRCSSAWAMAHGLPASLGQICKALALPLQKQTEGTRLIREYCAPDFRTTWMGEDKQLMQDYCAMDVATMRQIVSVLRPLSDEEWNQYHITERINDRGVPIDIEFATAALEYGDEIRGDVAAKIATLTGGKVTSATQRKSRDEWLTEQLSGEQLEAITVTSRGATKIKFDREYRSLLANLDGLPPEVEEFVDLVEQAGGATIAKYKAMVNTHVDGRVHGSLIWNGAGATGRYSSRGLQLQNFKRDVFSSPDDLIEAVITGVDIPRPADSLGRLVRSAITSPKGLTYSDYSQIEARVLPWLSADPKAEKTLKVFWEGRDIYTENALGMFNIASESEVNKDMRQAAKQGVLACGFGGGARAVQAMAKNYGMKYDFDKADGIKTAWRAANPWAMPFWYGLKDAARQAYLSPGVTFSHGRLAFQSDGKDFLWMRLPSGRVLAYVQPRIELVRYPWDDEGYELTCLWGAGKPKVGETWPRRVVNHLILSENATQGTAADIMRETIVRAHDAGLEILFSVHDELVVEGRCPDQLHALMIAPPVWADGLPIAADTSVADRYGK